VIAGHDMTVEAALMKLSYILSKDDWSLSQKREVRSAAFVTCTFHHSLECIMRV